MTIGDPQLTLHSLKHKHALKDYRSYAPPRHEGYALFIKEGNYDIAYIPFIVCFILTVIPSLYNLGLNRVGSVLTAIIYGLGLWASCSLASSRSRSRYALLVTTPRILIVIGYFSYYEDANPYVIMIFNALYTTIVRLLDKYSIRVDWKEVRNLVW